LCFGHCHRFLVSLSSASTTPIRKWEWEDLNGVIGTLLAADGCVLLLWLMVTLGR
jgi:hypothetical protein